MNENMEEKNIKKKQITKLVSVLAFLLLLVIGASYAYFTMSSRNAFGSTNLVGSTQEAGANVMLSNLLDGSLLHLNVSAEDMLYNNAGNTYWATTEAGVNSKSTEEIVNIAKAQALYDGNTYSCNYTLTVTDKASSENSLYNAFQSMPDKSTGQIALTIDNETFDFNTESLFPITYQGVLDNVSSSDIKYITSSMYIHNDNTKDQYPLNGKSINLEYKVTSFSCTETDNLPSIDTFAIGGRDNPDNVTVLTVAPVYLSFTNDNIEQYCISTTNKFKNCSWIDTNGKKTFNINYNLNGQTSGDLSLYAFIKDNNGNISSVKSDSATLTSGTLQFIVEEGVGEFYYKLGSETTYTRVTGTTTLNASPGAYTYYGLPSANYLMNECTKATPCTGNLGIEAQYRTVSATPSIGNGATYLINLANSNSTPNFISQSHPDSTVQTGTNQSTDYRYIGSSDNVENYVCLGAIQSNGQCQDNEHLYRIIGVMPTQTTKSGSYENRIKLIKSTAYKDNDISTNGRYYWTGQKDSGFSAYTSYSGATSNYNNWEESTLNRVVLNQTYYNSLEEKYQNMIGNSVWYLGGREDAKVPASTMYTAERSETIYSSGSKVNPTYAERKIGLIYPSDYGYATTGGTTTNRATCLTTNLFNWDGSGVTNCKDNDWLFMNGNVQWTITPRSSYSSYAFGVYSYGHVNNLSSVYDYQFVVRPVFSLTSETRVLSGTGSINSPYTLG